jgi:hypothetical protein
MQLRQGWTDEARALVERATAAIHSEGLSSARHRVHDRAGGFNDRDFFILVVDRKNYFRAFGVNPAKPTSLRRRLRAPTSWHAVGRGGGWVEYCSMHPVTKLIVDKIGYVLPSRDSSTPRCAA